MNSELLSASITEVANLISSRQLSPVELTRAQLESAHARNDELNAVSHFRDEQAMQDATEAEKEILSSEYRGPLHGVPVMVKDNIDIAGEPTAAGSTISAERTVYTDAFVVRRLRAAGAVIIAKTTMDEYAWGVSGVNPHTGAVRNPWNTATTASGSSGGSAAAVAADMAFAALGTDTGGSVRIPASVCGLVGVKATRGLVSTVGSYPLAWSLDEVGPLARNVEDAAITLRAIAGFDAREPFSTPGTPPDFTANLGVGVQNSVIGVERKYFFNEVDPRIAAVTNAVIQELENLGAAIVPVELPRIERSDWALTSTVTAEARTILGADLEHRLDEFGPDIRNRHQRTGDVSADEYLRAQRARFDIRRDFTYAFGTVDAIITPVLPTMFANAAEGDQLRTLTRFTSPFNLAGLPAMSIPAGFIDGLPIGIQIGTGAYNEPTMFKIAGAIESLGLGGYSGA